MSSAQQLLLTALRCDIDNLHHLATTADIVSDISQFIHVLQRERGASTIYLASQGKRFKARRATSKSPRPAGPWNTPPAPRAIRCLPPANSCSCWHLRTPWAT